MNRPIAQKVYKFFLEGITIGDVNYGFSKSMINDLYQNKPLLLKAFEVSDSDIVDYKLEELKPGQYELFTYHKENPSLPFNFVKEESAGTKRLFFILLMLIKLSQSDTTIFFDEFDLQLHIRLVEFLLEAVRASRVSQLVFTSHNSALLNRDYLRDEQILIVTKRSDGKSEIYPLSDFEGISKIKDIQKAYLQGRFDGVPYTGDIYSMIKEILNS